MSEKGSEDSPPRPKRKIKKVMVLSSDSSSDSDDSVAVAGSRRKRLRVLSDEGSDSSGSSVVCAGARRKRPLPKLRDSEGDSDTSGWAATDTSDSGTDTSDWATDHSDTPMFYVIGLGSELSPSSGPLCVSDAPKPASSATEPASGFASDSSEGNSDKCSICLLRFADQEVGTPQSCEHIFCLDCITEWSKNVNTCPVDRMTFDFIVVRACAGGRVLRTEPVKVVEPRPSVSTEDFLSLLNVTVCEVCGRRDIEEIMLMCCMCDRVYHMQCLTPPLSEVPMDPIGWFCPYCENLLRRALISERRNIRSSRMSSADEPSTSSGNSGRRLHFDNIDPNNIVYRGFWGNNTTSLNAVYGRLANRLLEDSD